MNPLLWNRQLGMFLDGYIIRNAASVRNAGGNREGKEIIFITNR